MFLLNSLREERALRMLMRMAFNCGGNRLFGSWFERRIWCVFIPRNHAGERNTMLFNRIVWPFA